MDNSKHLDGIYSALWSLRFHIENINIIDLPCIQIKDRKSFSTLPVVACVYFVSVGGKIVYVGKAIDLWNRWQSHKHLGRLLSIADGQISWLELAPRDLTIIEAVMIQRLTPEWNQTGKREENDDLLRGDPERFRNFWRK